MLLPTTLLILLVVTTHQRSVSQNTDCAYHSSNYSVNWTYDELSNDVVFKLTARSTFSNFYTAIAFGNEKPEDVIAVYVRSLQIGLIDGHLVDDGAIESDEKTNVQALQFDLQDSVLTAQFARPIETFDPQDANLGYCITMFLPTEAREIITGAPLELGDVNSLQKIRVCDIAVTCATKMQNDVLVKRQEDSDVAPICSSGAEDEKNRVEWKVEEDKIRFSVFQNSKKGRWWTAIGVGHSMLDLNMIILFAENGKLKRQGIYRTEGRMEPLEVQLEGVQVKKDSALTVNGKSKFNVSIEKKFFLERMDEQGCFTMQVAVLGGQYQPNFNIQKHQITPQALQICNLDACRDPIAPQQEIDGETPQRTERPSVKEDEDIVGPEASGFQPTRAASSNDVEGSGLPAEPKTASSEPNELKSTPHAAEIAEEKPLTGNDSPDKSSSANSPSQTTPLPMSITPQANHVFAVDNQTTNRVNGNEAVSEKSAEAPTKSPETSGEQKKSGCGVDHEDLKICDSYFSEYLGKVNEWSEKHNMTITSHMWKACTLLSQVQHVTTMCCTIFRNTCATHLNL